MEKREQANVAAEALKITSSDLLSLEIIDGIIKEPLGGAHYDPELTAKNIADTVIKSIDELSKLSGSELKKDRHERFRRMGVFVE
ncbi:MAG: hypothetical protein MZU97_02780 [Bacillus subtilis]|nr:hypothetical protein [Bacillus subtilis]